MAKHLVCYVVTENKDKKYWNKIGAAFENRDGSLSVVLDAFPVNGQMQIREYVPRDEREDTRDSRNSRDSRDNRDSRSDRRGGSR